MTKGLKKCVITGANGFLGSRLQRHLESKGWRVLPWTRKLNPPAGAISFRLGDDVSPAGFQDVDALIHCAYDFAPLAWNDIARVNIHGSEKLLQAAQSAGLQSIVFISSLSAFPGCRSWYGKAKLETEGFALASGASVIRPGLIYGDHPGGMFGRLVRQVRNSRVLPLLTGGRQLQYLLHEEDLGQLILDLLERKLPSHGEPIAAAHEQGWELKEILKAIGRGLSRPVVFFPVPWRAAWLGLKVLELAGVRTNFRSDSLLGMVYQDPNPSFAAAKALGLRCRPFRLVPAMLD
jgi:nucleoside-diphosphate-sugar epimerase